MPKSKNKNIELSKTVKLFSDENRTGKQKVSLSSEDQFLSVIHDVNEIVISVENWQSLNELVNQALHIQNNIKV